MSMLFNSTQAVTAGDGVDVVTASGEVVRRVFSRQSFKSDQPTLTQQQFLDESDINNIIARYNVTGVVNSAARPPMFGDFSNLPSYQEALDIVNRGADAFMSLSSDIRSRFENDPAKFLEFAYDPANKEQLVKWRVLAPDPVPETILGDVVNELKAGRPSEPPKEA